MGANSRIEWTDATWNPVRGCTRVSEGCRHCYAEAVAARFSGPGQPFHGLAARTPSGPRWTGKIDVAWHLLDLPLRWRRPRRIFVNSMSDLFHEAVDQEEIATIIAMAVAAVHLRGHTFQVLTKRAGRMAMLLRDPKFWDEVNAEAGAHVMERTDPHDRRRGDARATLDEYGPDHPPPGIWLGVSVENQAAADERIPHLLAVPAAVRFLSCEPLLGPVDLSRRPAGSGWNCWLTGRRHRGPGVWSGDPRIDWVIAGGESGPGARPTHPDWVRSLRDQCAAADVPFFFKQWGAYIPARPVYPLEDRIWAEQAAVRAFGPGTKPEDVDLDAVEGIDDWMREFPDLGVLYRDGYFYDGVEWQPHVRRGCWWMERVGKKAAGALLDGREHREFPGDPR